MMLPLTPTLAVVLAMCTLGQGIVLEKTPISEICYTTMGKQSVKDVPTSSLTVTSTATKTVVYHVESTETVQAPVVTTTTTALSAKVIYDDSGKETASVTAEHQVYTNSGQGTVTVHGTVVLTTTKTVTVHPTTTKTQTITKTTQSTKTSTIPTSSGFVPISTSLPGSKQRRDLVQSKPKVSRRKGKYAQNVDCKVIETVTSTITDTTTELATVTAEARTAVSTATQITTGTVTRHPNAKAAVTSQTTSTKTVTITKTGSASTTTVTKTTTTTNVSPGPTIYAACSSQNLMQQYQGHNIDDVTGDYGNEVLVNSATSLYLCCAACFESPTTCSVGSHDGDDPTDCWIYTNKNNQCGPQKTFTYTAISCNYGGFGAFNGNCGSVNKFVNYGDSCD